MNNIFSFKQIILIFAVIAVALAGGRLAKGNFDFSYFITAGNTYTDSAKTPTPITTQKGQGYDGQFFYRYALDPFSFTNDVYGIHIDHPAYRQQRIMYPLLAWLLSIGGQPALAPVALVLVNLLAFLGIGLFMRRLVKLFNGLPAQALYPLLLCGLYMSLARDLSEVVELFFFTGAIYYLFKERYLQCGIFLSLTLLTRDTSIIAIAPLLACMWLRASRKLLAPGKLFFFILPFLVFAMWKAIIYINIPSVADATAGYVSYGLPFRGIMMGFKENLNFTDTLYTFQFAYWAMYLLWQLCFVGLVLQKGTFAQLLQMDNAAVLKVIYLAWLAVAVCLSDNIYGDDWGFVRVFSLWNMVGFIILIVEGKHLGRWFSWASVVVVGFTIVRLVWRV